MKSLQKKRTRNMTKLLHLPLYKANVWCSRNGISADACTLLEGEFVDNEDFYKEVEIHHKCLLETYDGVSVTCFKDGEKIPYDPNFLCDLKDERTRENLYHKWVVSNYDSTQM